MRIRRLVRFETPMAGRIPARAFRPGFLVSDLIAGIALAGLVLALAATMLKTDLQIRAAREARLRMLIRFENALARAETTPADRLSQAAVRSFLDDISRGGPPDAAPVEITVTDLPGKPAGKRVVLRSSVSNSIAGRVFLMRDFYAGGKP